MKYGLSDTTLLQITTCIQGFSTLNWVKIYGSRAKGNFRPNSDIDLAFSGPVDKSASLLAALDELPTPYLFNVTHYESIENADLKNHIDRVGQFIYTKVY